MMGIENVLLPVVHLAAAVDPVHSLARAEEAAVTTVTLQQWRKDISTGIPREISDSGCLGHGDFTDGGDGLTSQPLGLKMDEQKLMTGKRIKVPATSLHQGWIKRDCSPKVNRRLTSVCVYF